MPKTIKNRLSKTGHIDFMVKINDKEIRIRRFQSVDIIEIIDIISYHLVNTYSQVYSKEVVMFYKEYHSVENICSDAQKGIMLVAEYNGQIIGTGTLLNDYLKRFFIKKGFQNKNIGTLLVSELEKYAVKEKIKTLQLDAIPGSTIFYEKLNYRIVQKCTDKINDKGILDYYKMEKNLFHSNSHI